VRLADESPEAVAREPIKMLSVATYLRVFLTFARNSLIRDMMFPTNFIIESISSIAWMLMNLGFYVLVFQNTEILSNAAGDAVWTKYQFFVFLATTMFVNSTVQMFFMTNAEEFSELIRSGNLDFALLKPIDTQFLISLHRIDWSSLADFVIAIALLGYAVPRLDDFEPTLTAIALYPLYVVLGVLIMYSVMVALSATSVWLGRNQTLYDFWFYITNFSRYPLEIYDGPVGIWLRRLFLFVVPVLVVVNVPARLMAKPFQPDYAYLALYGVAATIICLAASRWVFQRSLASYRSASS
jgi:ABC-2 type transport system permease protein